jgi:hypothetical protein
VSGAAQMRVGAGGFVWWGHDRQPTAPLSGLEVLPAARLKEAEAEEQTEENEDEDEDEDDDEDEEEGK